MIESATIPNSHNDPVSFNSVPLTIEIVMAQLSSADRGELSKSHVIFLGYLEVLTAFQGS